MQSVFCVLLVYHEWEHISVDTANTAHLPHTTTSSKHHSYLPFKTTETSNKKNIERTYRDGIPKKQPNKIGMIPQYPSGLSSLYLLPFFQPHTHTHTHTPIPGMPHQPYPQPIIECGNCSTSQCNTHHPLTLQLLLHMQQYTL